ncbi:MAG TPA: outer membrane protein assembly factor BamB [Burkholderiales bacterium]|jgi:outer membrane protein assembly factor BamB|nr:outer membrane protein assembly factor BamB [Burkholderiales bacterium]
MRLAAVAIAALALAGCGLFGSSSGPKPAPLPPLERAQDVRVLWTAQVGGADRFVFTPAVAGDAVYSAGRDGTLARLDAASGAVRWRASAERRLSAGVGSDGRIAAVATEDGEVIAFDAASGALRWRARVSSEVLAAPAVGGGLVLVRSVDNRIFAFAEEDGKRRWVYQRAPASLIVRSPAGMTVLGDTAFAGFSGGKLAAIALSNGGVRWEATVASPKGATELERVTDVVGEPVVQGREVCAAAYQGRVACYDLTSGRQIWARDVSSLTGVSFDARYALVSDDRDAVHALDRTNGRSVWKQDRLTHRRLSRPASAGAAVAVGDLEGYVHFLARDSGAFIARYSTGGGAVRAAPVNLPSGLLVQTQNGTLVALGL